MFRGDWARRTVLTAGAGLLVAGGGSGLAGMAVPGRNRTPYLRPRAGSELGQRGIYGRVRHPLDTRVMLGSRGRGLIWQGAAAPGAAPVLILFLFAKAQRRSAGCAKKWFFAVFSG